MKKRLLTVFLLFASVLLLTGCGGGKKLVCTMNQRQNAGQFYVDLNAKVEMGYSGENEEINSMDINIELIIPDDLYEALQNEGNIEENMKAIAEAFAQGYTGSMPADAATFDYKINKNKINITSSIDMSKATKAQTKTAAKEQMEGSGFTCK